MGIDKCNSVMYNIEGKEMIHMTPLKKEFYSVNELAEVLGVNPMTVRRLEQRGELKSHRVGRIKRYRREDIEAYLKKARE